MDAWHYYARLKRINSQFSPADKPMGTLMLNQAAGGGTN